MKKFYILVGGAAAVAVAVVGFSVASRGGGGAALTPVELGELSDEALVALAQGVGRGNEDAAVTIIEFGDFQCPSCQVFATQVEPAVNQAFVETGEARFVFYDAPIINAHPNAFLAARSARCADDQGKFWEYHDYLYRNQSQWSTLASPIGLLAGYAELLEMDKGDFEACVRSDRHASLVTANLELARRVGVERTPTILVAKDGVSREVPPTLEAIQEYVGGLLTAGDPSQ